MILELEPRRSQRQRTPPDRLGTIAGDWWNYQDYIYASIDVSDAEEPKNTYEALNGKNSRQWQEATDSEYKSSLQNKTWKLVDIPKKKVCYWLQMGFQGQKKCRW